MPGTSKPSVLWSKKSSMIHRRPPPHSLPGQLLTEVAGGPQTEIKKKLKLRTTLLSEKLQVMLGTRYWSWKGCAILALTYSLLLSAVYLMKSGIIQLVVEVAVWAQGFRDYPRLTL